MRIRYTIYKRYSKIKKLMDPLFLLQFACFIFMLINAFIVAVSHLHVRWENKRYERSRWMIVVALIGLAIQAATDLLPCCSSILRLSLLATVIFQQKSYWIKINEAERKTNGMKRKNIYSNCLRSAETLSKTVLTNGVWIWAIRIVM